MPSAKILEAKKAQVKELAEKLANAKMTFFVDYKGITVDEDKDLRKGIIEKTDVSKKIVYERKGKGGKIIQVQRLREKFKPESIKFQGYYLIGGTNAIVYSYDEDTYVIEQKSPKKGQGATFDVVPKAEWDKNVNNGYINNSFEYSLYYLMKLV